MAKLRSSNFVLWLLSSTLLLLSVGCNSNSQTGLSNKAATQDSIPSQSQSPTPVQTTERNAYQLAINQGAKAIALSQSSQSKDDWNLVASRWQKAISLLKSVSLGHSNFAQSQKKLVEYQQNFIYAKKKASQRITEPEAIISIGSDSTKTRVTSACEKLELDYELTKITYNNALAWVDAFDSTEASESLAMQKLDLAEADLKLSQIQIQYQQQCL